MSTHNELKPNDDVHVTCQHQVCNLYVFICRRTWFLLTNIAFTVKGAFTSLTPPRKCVYSNIKTKSRKYRLQVRPSLEPIM